MYPLTAVSSAQTVAGYHHRAQLAQSQSRCSEMNIVSSLQMLCRGGAHWLTAKKKKKKCARYGLVRLHVWTPHLQTFMVMWWHAHIHACIPHVCTETHLRSHTPFSCVVLLPSVTFLLSNTRASLKLTSQESSDSSPEGDNRGVRGGRKEEANIFDHMRTLSARLTCLSVVKLLFAVHTEHRK